MKDNLLRGSIFWKTMVLAEITAVGQRAMEGTDGVIDDYISSLKHFTQPGTELTAEILEKLRETGLQHSLFDFLCRCYLVETEQADDALVDATDAEAKHYVEAEIPQLGYRAYKVMALIAEKKNKMA